MNLSKYLLALCLLGGARFAQAADEFSDDFSTAGATWYSRGNWSVLQVTPATFAYRGDYAGDGLSVKTDATLGNSWKLDVDVQFRKYYATSNTRGLASFGTFAGVDFGVQLLASADMFSNGSVGINVAWWNATNQTWNTVLDAGYLPGASSGCHLQLVRPAGSNSVIFTVTSTNGFGYRGTSALIPANVLNAQRFAGLRDNYAQLDFSNFVLIQGFDAGLPAVITTQPKGQVLPANGATDLRVIASSAIPAVYQWYKDGTNLPSAASSTLSLRNIQSSQAGNYFVTVSNAFGVVTSSIAAIQILFPPAITAQPQSQTVDIGADAVFSVSVSGSLPQTFQWRKDGIPIGGATNSTYVITNAQPAHTAAYSVVIVGPGSTSVTSQAAALNVVPGSDPPHINLQPRELRLRIGESESIFVSASGTAPLSYQWYRGFSGDTNDLVAGATGADYRVTNATTTVHFWVKVSNAFGSVNSETASVLVFPANAARLNLSFVAGFPRLQISGVVGGAYRIEYTSGLGTTNWTSLLNFVLPADPFTYLDAGAGDTPYRFYRVTLQP